MAFKILPKGSVWWSSGGDPLGGHGCCPLCRVLWLIDQQSKPPSSLCVLVCSLPCSLLCSLYCSLLSSWALQLLVNWLVALLLLVTLLGALLIALLFIMLVCWLRCPLAQFVALLIVLFITVFVCSLHRPSACCASCFSSLIYTSWDPCRGWLMCISSAGYLAHFYARCFARLLVLIICSFCCSDFAHGCICGFGTLLLNLLPVGRGYPDATPWSACDVHFLLG